MAKPGFLPRRSSWSGIILVKNSHGDTTISEDCRVCFVDVAKGPSMLEGRRGFSAFNVAEAHVRTPAELRRLV